MRHWINLIENKDPAAQFIQEMEMKMTSAPRVVIHRPDAWMTLRRRDPGYVTIEDYSCSRDGAGTELMIAMGRRADQLGITLGLRVHAYTFDNEFLDEDALLDYFEEFDFEIDMMKSGDETWMMRPPGGLLENFDHPHLRGEDEIFSMLHGAYTLNVDLARRLIASGEIQATPYAMPVLKGGQMLLQLDADEFGAGDVDGELGMGMTHVDRKRFAVIPAEKFDEPAIMVMWNALRADPKMNRGMPDQAYPVLIDGNHRLEKRFLDGDEGTMSTLVIRDFDDIKKFAYDRQGKLLADKK